MFPKVDGRGNMEEWLPRELETRLTRLRSGHAGCAGYLHRVGLAERPLCEDCGVMEDLQHVLLHCPRYQGARLKLQGELRQMEWGDQVVDLFIGPRGPGVTERVRMMVIR